MGVSEVKNGAGEQIQADEVAVLQRAVYSVAIVCATMRVTSVCSWNNINNEKSTV